MHRIQRRVCVTILIALLCCGIVGLWPGIREAEVKDVYKEGKLYIDKYETELEFFRDNTVTIHETVSVQFNTPRHGVTFILPRHDREGERIELSGFRANHYFYENRSYNDPNATFVFGNPLKEDDRPKVYDLRYTYNLGKNADYEENIIYWNIIGTKRPYYHADVRFKVTLPESVDKKAIRFYVGEEGSRGGGRRVSWKLEDGNVIVGKLKGDLKPNEAVTLRIELPRGYYTNVRDVNPFSFLITSRLRWYDLLVLLFIPLSYLVWKRKGKEPPVVETVEFYPPADTNPAEAAYLYYGNSVIADFAPLVVSWADQGALHIQELPRKDTRFYRRVNYPKGKQYEQRLYMDMFDIGDGSSVCAKELEKIYYDDLVTARKAMFSDYTVSKGTEPRNYPAEKKAHKSQRRVALLMSLVPIGTMLVNHFYREVAGGGAWLYGIIAALIGLWVHRRGMLSRADQTEERKVQTQKVRAWLPSIHEVLLTLLAFVLIGLIMWDAGALISFILYLLVMFYINYNVRRIHLLTDFGRWHRGKLGGFRTFIRAAEVDRIKMLVDENPYYFYHVLPYAMNLGVTDQWISKFRTLAIPPPEWFTGKDGDFGDPTEIPDRLVSTVSNAQSFMTKAPPSKSDSDSSDSSGDSGSSSSSGSAGGGSGGSGMGDW